jgi:NADH-quinone oxidoreductase subunit B
MPVDVYVPGCPPRPETLLEGVMAIQRIVDEDGVQPSHVRGGGRGLRMAVAGPATPIQVGLPGQEN